MVYLFLDTNIYIHYLDFEQVEWNKMLSLNKDETIQIVIPPIIIEEIDNLKDRESNAKRKKKAKAISSKIADYLLYDKKGKYNVITCDEPSELLFEEYRLDKSKNDNSFLLSAKLFEKQNNGKVKIIAADNGVLIKAKKISLDFEVMDSSFLLKEEPTDEEKEIKQIKESLRKYEQRQSKPVLTFENGETILRINKPQIINIEEVILNKINIKKEEYPYWDKEKVNHLIDKNPYGFAYKLVDETKISAYNDKLNEYFEDYSLFLKNTITSNILSMFLPELNLYISNGEGSSPTGDLFINITFPSNIDLYDSSNIEYFYQDEPIPPPKSILEFNSFGLTISRRFPVGIFGGHFETQHTKWNLTNKAEIKHSLNSKSVMHGLRVKLDLDGLSLDIRSCPNFEINYKIIDSTLIEAIEGKLNLIIE